MARFADHDLLVDLGFSIPFPGDRLVARTAALLKDKLRRETLGRRAREAVEGRGIERTVAYIIEEYQVAGGRRR